MFGEELAVGLSIGPLHWAAGVVDTFSMKRGGNPEEYYKKGHSTEEQTYKQLEEENNNNNCLRCVEK